ncbi:DUF2442 domain-containing protein [Massilia sp. HP4]|uniref:DUF2442 domain-containing protein n=1 Tax=Massilia sp. HP4 TaxID=2562316 RepID=UPI0010C13C73|nr:DUF2442 domain-containing protein [Massilia sp. HP4]
MKTIRSRKREGSAVTDAVRERAIEKGNLRAQCEPHATNVRYIPDSRSIALEFSDSTAVLLPIANYPELAPLSGSELARLTLGFGGTALCLEESDLDIAIAGLVAASALPKSLANAVVAAAPPKVTYLKGIRRLGASRSSVDRVYVNLHETWEIQYWTKALGVSEEALRHAALGVKDIRKEHIDENGGDSAITYFRV